MNPELSFDALQKPERAKRKAAKRIAKGKRRRTRAWVRAERFRRSGGKCDRCARPVSYDVAPWRDERAQCNEILPKSLGGDPLDVENTELLCRVCHFGGPSGAHAPTADRMVR